jgi:protein dithiol oxidoreductase (disulfide-forming)
MLKRFLTIILCGLACITHAETFTEGKDYVTLSSTNLIAKDTPSVIEFFSYGCPACFHIENTISSWVKQNKDRIHFSRIPVVFHTEWEVYAKAYYTAEALELLPHASEMLFKAIQVDNKTLKTNEEMIKFFTEQLNVKTDIAKSAFEHSPTIELQIQKGMAKAARLGINQIPSFIVNAHYKTDMSMAKDPERLIAILNELIKK